MNPELLTIKSQIQEILHRLELVELQLAQIPPAISKELADAIKDVQGQLSIPGDSVVTPRAFPVDNSPTEGEDILDGNASTGNPRAAGPPDAEGGSRSADR